MGEPLILNVAIGSPARKPKDPIFWILRHLLYHFLGMLQMRSAMLEKKLLVIVEMRFPLVQKGTELRFFKTN